MPTVSPLPEVFLWLLSIKRKKSVGQTVALVFDVLSTLCPLERLAESPHGGLEDFGFSDAAPKERWTDQHSPF